MAQERDGKIIIDAVMLASVVVAVCTICQRTLPIGLTQLMLEGVGRSCAVQWDTPGTVEGVKR